MDTVTPTALAGLFCKHDDKTGEFTAQALKLGIVTADGSEPNELAVEQFKGGCADYFGKHIWQPVFYVITSEADGRIELVDKGTKGAAEMSVAYARSLAPSELAKIKGTREDLASIKGQLCRARDAVSQYISNKYKRLEARVDKARGPKKPTRDFWTFVNDELNAIGKKAKKEKVCSDAEFKVAMVAFIARLKGETK